jgi:pimeloyl-ACP methyl ester carboxylesterase
VKRTAPSEADRFVRVDGMRVRVRVQGGGEPVLLINGLGGNVEMWTALAPHLDGLEVISFDAPGTGRSATRLTPYTIASAARVAGGVLDQLGHERADVLGYSLGGLVAQQFAHDAPQRVRRLVLAATSCGIGHFPGSMRALMAIMTPIRYHGKAGNDLAMAILDLAPEERDEAFLARTSLARQAATPSTIGYALQMASFWTFSSLPWLHRLEHPTLVLAGTHDHLVPPANAALLSAYLANARLLLYERWGHYFLHDNRSGAGGDVANFLRADDAQASASWEAGHAMSQTALDEFVRETGWSPQPMAIAGGIMRRAFPVPDLVGEAPVESQSRDSDSVAS